MAWLAWDSKETAAELFAIAGVIAVTVFLFSTGAKRPVSLRSFEYETKDGKGKIEAPGLEVPRDVIDKAKRIHEGSDYVWQRGLFFRGLFMGKDGRWSTSKLQVLLWTYGIVFALASILIAEALGVKDALKHLQDEKDSTWSLYFILLGGPFAAFVLAKGITASQVESGQVAKTQAVPTANPAEGLSQVISNDAGETDIVDLQYFLFNVLALVYFLGSFVPNPDGGLPEVPEFLAALTGASALAYVGKKAVERERPTITAVLPTTPRTGRKLDVWGRSLVLDQASQRRKPHVSIGPEDVPEEHIRIVSGMGAGTDQLQLTVPRTLEPGQVKLRIVTVAGVAAETDLELQSGVQVRTVSVGKIVLAAPAELTVIGEEFGAEERAAAVFLDGTDLSIKDWTDTSITASLKPDLLQANAYKQNAQAKLVVQDADGRRSNSWQISVE